MQAALKIDDRVRAPQAPLKRPRTRAKIFFLHGAQHVKRPRSILLVREGATFAATLLAIVLWGIVLLLQAG